MTWYKTLWWIPSLLLFVIGVPSAIQAYRIATYGGETGYGMQSFARNNPSATLKILFLGDSTVVGTGASSRDETTAGWFGRDFPQAHIVNISKNGARLADLLRDFHPDPGARYDVAIIQIGANDIMHLTPLSTIKVEIAQLVDRMHTVADTIVILHSGNVGLAPIFSWPFTEILGWRSASMRAIYRKTAQERGALYVDLWASRQDDVFLTDIPRYYSADLLHPSGEGYRVWSARIRQTLYDAGISLSDR